MNEVADPTDRPATDANPEVTIDKIIGGGRGLAHHEGETMMISGALPGERVVAQPTRRRAGIVEAKCIEVIGNPHPARLQEPCPSARSCGGCDWPHVDPASGAALKAAAAAEAARSTPELAQAIVGAVIHRSPPASRLRARLHWNPDDKRLGFFKPQSHDVADIAPCRILSPQLMQALPLLSESLARRCDAAVDVEWLEGTDPSGAVAALRPAKGGPRETANSWIPDSDEVSGVVAGFHRLSRSGHPRSGWGPDRVFFDLAIPLEVPIGAFFQGNRFLLDPLFQKVSALAGDGGEPVFDLHAGVGFLAAAALSRGPRELFLAEPHFGAAQAAQKNLPDAQVAIGMTAEEALRNNHGLPSEALVITDPPRSGMSRELLRMLGTWHPRRILMLGCDPATWNRDTAHLMSHGYRLSEIELFDLFPHTHHVEILAMLETT